MPEEVIGNIKTIENGSDFGIKSENSPYAIDFHFADFYDDRLVKKFIKSTERLIRQSREYKGYIESLRSSVFELNHDNILGNITNGDVELEFHHYPFSLYDIIEILMIKHISEKVRFTSFSIAKEVMELHYKHYIGLVSLTKTTHELAHSGNLFIAENQIFGNYKKFMELYKDGISNQLRSQVQQMEDYTKANIPSDFKGLFK